MWINKTYNFILDLFSPQFCFGCRKEGTYLCNDCRAYLEISQYQYCLCKEPIILSGKCRLCRAKKLDGLYFAVPYQKALIKKLIQYFKYEPFVKELAKPLASLIIEHFHLLEKQPGFLSNKISFILTPIPLDKKRLRWRGFNQAEEIAKELSKFLNIPLLPDCLIKIKRAVPQVELSDESRRENIKGAFVCEKSEKIKGKAILLVDDVYTTGSTMEEAAKVLREAGAKEVIGVVVARD